MRATVRFLLIPVVMSCASATTSSPAQQPAPAPPPCAAPEHRQMDFWVGSWDARWEASPGMAAGTGSNVITREYGGCVIQEQFDGGPSTGGLLGHSVSMYHAPAKRWRQTWVDNQGGYFALDGGPEGDGFVLISRNPLDGKPQGRMVFEEIEASRFTWRWQKSADGGATWTDSWVIFYSRRGAAPSSP
jgi:hypothetical protein